MENATEWYDYGAYAVVATYIAAHFFPSGSEGLFWTYAFLAISFIARPFGGFVWGPLGDRLGRKQRAGADDHPDERGDLFLIGVLQAYSR